MTALYFLVIAGFAIFLAATIPSAIAIYRYYFGGGKLLHDRLPRHLERR